MLGSTFESSEEAGDTISEINVTPLVDVVLVLLIVFLITVPSLVYRGIKVDLPNASAAPTQNDLRLIVTLKNESTGGYGIYANGIPTDLEKIQPLVNDLVSRDPDVTATVASDEGIPIGDVVQVMNRLADLGVRDFSLSTERSSP
jgi:biopolymer transport protein ExbD